MDKLTFKSNINCDACVAKITPILNENTQIKTWEVNTQNPDKILSIQGENIDTDELTLSLQKIGYKIKILT